MKTTALQGGGRSTPFASNTQDFSGSDDEILDNFAEGPDDGIPLGVGGERGKQSEPASATLEADIVNGTTKQPGVEPEKETADGTEPVQDPAGETVPETSPETDAEEPGIPPILLQMAGYADVAAAEADGLGTPEALNAFIRGRGQLLATKPDDSSVDMPYGIPRQEKREDKPPEAPPTPTDSAKDFEPFKLTDEDREVLDEQLIDTIDRLNAHHQRQFDELRGSLSQRESATAEERAEQEVREFDKAVQSLGEGWQDLFGEGDFTELVRKGQSDPQARLALEYRRELFDTVQAIRDVNTQRGFDSMDLQREIGFGLMQRFPDKFQTTISGKSSQNGNGRTTLNRPTQRKSPDANHDALLKQLNRKYPNGGFTYTDPEDFVGEI